MWTRGFGGVQPVMQPDLEWWVKLSQTQSSVLIPEVTINHIIYDKDEEGRIRHKNWKGKNGVLNKSKETLMTGGKEEENEGEINMERETKSWV